MKDKKPSLGMEVVDTDNINMIDINNVIQIVESMEKRIAELQEKLDIIEKILFKDKK